MQYFNLLATAALLPTALAYGYGSGSDSSTTTPSAPVSQKATDGTHIIKVGQGDKLIFEPANLTVPMGDTVEFHFWPKAHSVAQSSFDKPCEPLNQTAGFFSGPVVVASGMSPSVYRVVVNSTAPIWFYCATGKHCQAGMAGVINAPASTTKTLPLYQAAAAKAAENVTPASVKGGVMGTASTTGSSPSGTSTPGAAIRGAVPWVLMAGVGAVGGFLA